jgi:acetyl-CoA decarbonylase/synthase complex subunit epsilon
MDHQAASGEASQKEKIMMETMRIPYRKVNVLTGLKAARVIEEPKQCAELIEKAKRPLLVIGPNAVDHFIEGRLHLEYCLDLVKKADIPVCATAHVKKKMLEFGTTPDSVYDIIEIINHLRYPDWKGVKKEGSHDLVIFSGVRCDLAEQGLSALKHFAPHLKTMALCRYSHPNADYALPILSPEKWKTYWDGLLANMKTK